jgi:hypothetical protein
LAEPRTLRTSSRKPAERVDIRAQIEKERRQAERDRLHAEEEPLLDFFDQVEILFQVAMKAAGWYQHHRQCRRKGKITMGKRKQILSLGLVPGPGMEAAIARRLFADDDGTLVDTHGAGIARNAENALISRSTVNENLTSPPRISLWPTAYDRPSATFKTPINFSLDPF